jgi:putative ABC transport system permease protein
MHTRMLESLRHDLRFALRSLARRPLFATITVVTLALGIGGTTAIFSVVDGVLIRELPYRNASSLVSVWRAWPSWRDQGQLDAIWDHIQFDLANYHSARDNATTLADIQAHAAQRRVLMGGGRAEEISVGLASAGLFELLGVRPAFGRTFVAEEALPAAANGARVVLLSHQLWARRFGSDDRVLGRTIVMGGDSYEVIGVLPAHFRLVSDMVTTHENGGVIDSGVRDVWIPLGRAQANCGNCLEILARLVPGRTTVEARADVQRLLIDQSNHPEQLARVVVHKERITQGFETPLFVLFSAAGVLLLIACLNVAGLLAGEATGREQEMAVRSALGAGKRRIARQLLTESALLGLIGALAGVFVAWLATGALLSVAPPMPRLNEVGVSVRALLFATVVGVTTGIAFGLAPAVSLMGNRDALQSRGLTRRRRAASLHAGMVSIQLGLTVILLIVGGLFGRSLGRLMSVDPGFTPERLATFAFDVPAARASSEETIRQFQFQVVQGVAGVPGVTAVSLTSELPFPGGKGSRSFALEPDGPMSQTAMWHRSVLPNYHDAMGIPLLAGRRLGASDRRGAPNVIVVSQSFAEQIWPGESPLGKRIYKTGPVGAWTVVGVVGDVRHKALGAPVEPTIYRTVAQAPMRRLYLVARTADDPAALSQTLQRAIWALDADTPITESGVMTSLVRSSEADDWFRAIIMWTFAGLAAALAAVGIFGVTARAVAGRAQEMGIRSALGAQRWSLVALVLRQCLATSACGLAIGLVGAFWASRLIQSLLYGVQLWDPLTYGGVVGLVLAMCLMAGYVPARRVTRISVMEVLWR